MSHGCDEDKEIGKRGNELTDLLKWEIAQSRVSSGSNSVGKKALVSQFCSRQQREIDRDQKKRTQGMEAASMTKSLCNDVALNY